MTVMGVIKEVARIGVLVLSLGLWAAIVSAFVRSVLWALAG
jgi:hypothetical protein